MYTQIEVKEHAHQLGKSERTLWRCIRQDCDLRDPKSVREWVTRNTIRETNISKARKRRRDNESHNIPFSNGTQTSVFEPAGNGDGAVEGRKGAAAALERLESQEESAHRRLQGALQRGNPIEIQPHRISG
jgi:hypothetical protein